MHFLRHIKQVSLVLLGAAMPPLASAQNSTQAMRAASEHYVAMVFAHYTDLLQEVLHLRDVVSDFVRAPDADGLKKAKERWIAARMIYGPSEVYRFYNGPVDNADFGHESLINAWPLDEIFIDGSGISGGQGIIDQPEVYPEITSDSLAALNEAGSEKNIATGFHAIEFLLWGQDLNHGTPQELSAGLRPYTDYLDGEFATAPFGERRRAYLVATADLLVRNIAELVAAWNPENPRTYGALWLENKPEKNLTKMMTGMATLAYAELAGERMFAAIDEQDQEHEQSCFSDTTHLDIAANLMGIENVYFGRLAVPPFTAPHNEGFSINLVLDPHEGAGVRSYLKTIDPAMVASLDEAFFRAQASVKAIPTPFDNALKTSTDLILRAIEALRNLGLKIQEAGHRHNLNVTIEPADGD